MTESPIHLSVVVPVRNGADRLRPHLETLRRYVCAQGRPTELVLVDDHSEPDAARLLADFARSLDGATLLRNDANRGKGFSVARGMAVARGARRVFTDADLAYPVEEIDHMVRELEGGADVAIACRVLPESRYLMSPSFFHYLYTRHLLSRVYNTAVRWSLLPGILDSQAGLKGFTARAAEIVFPRLSIHRFGFDVEALFLARRHGLRTAQVPVSFRYDSEPTTVRFARDGRTLLTDLARVRWNDLRGRYR